MRVARLVVTLCGKPDLYLGAYTDSTKHEFGPNAQAWFCPVCAKVWARADIVYGGDFRNGYSVVYEPCPDHGRASLKGGIGYSLLEKLPHEALKREILIAASDPELYLSLRGKRYD